jgi:hypothetical protein
MDPQWVQGTESGEEELMEGLRRGMGALSAFSDESPYTRKNPRLSVLWRSH